MGRCLGVGRDLGVGVGLTVAVGVGVGVEVAIGVAVAVAVGVAVAIGVAVAVAVGGRRSRSRWSGCRRRAWRARWSWRRGCSREREGVRVQVKRVQRAIRIRSIAVRVVRP